MPWLNHLCREARGSPCFFEGNGRGDATGHSSSERGRTAPVCAGGQPASTCGHGWHSPLGNRGSSPAAALGSFCGHLLQRQVGEGDAELFCTNPFHLLHGRKIALDHGHETHFSLKPVCRKTVLSLSALFWV